ncbi:MAG: hypothetical protein OEZ43_21750 [Gammaproteobacteria bacterium]|nr:hypothetical protein [Gammaproteobacteria bacterium]
MGFINEYVSEEDDRKYGLEEIDKRYRKAHSRPSWTIDRERNIYLRWMYPGREEYFDHFYFTFYWQDTLFDVDLEYKGSYENGEGQTVWTLVQLSTPGKLRDKRAEIIHDLKEALVVFKDFGVRSRLTAHKAIFEF